MKTIATIAGFFYLFWYPIVAIGIVAIIGLSSASGSRINLVGKALLATFLTTLIGGPVSGGNFFPVLPWWAALSLKKVEENDFHLFWMSIPITLVIFYLLLLVINFIKKLDSR